MQMNTEQKLANTHTMKVPRKIELLDMADTSLQKVHTLYTVALLDQKLKKTIMHRME